MNPRKVFPADPGLIALFDRSGRANLGHALETAILLALLRRGAEVCYVRTRSGFEMDFLARFLGGDERLIQVCADMSDGPTLERELRGLTDAAREFPRASRHIITLTPEAATSWPEGVTAHAAEPWLLTEDHQDE